MRLCQSKLSNSPGSLTLPATQYHIAVDVLPPSFLFPLLYTSTPAGDVLEHTLSNLLRIILLWYKRPFRSLVVSDPCCGFGAQCGPRTLDQNVVRARPDQWHVGTSTWAMHSLCAPK